MLTLPMSRPRRNALRVRARNQSVREIAGRDVAEPYDAMLKASEMHEGPTRVRRPFGSCRSLATYWTVTLPFMFMARCGVQKKSYVPAGTFANDTT